VFVALGIRHAKRMLLVVICGLSGFFPHYFINGTIFRKEKATEHKICVLIFSTTLSETFLILKLEFSRQTFEKY
jgi:hypothetical protein